MKSLVNQFLSTNETPKYVFGINPYTDDLIDYLKGKNVVIKGLIDLIHPIESYKEYPIIHDLESLEKNAIVLNTVTMAYPRTINKKIKSYGIQALDLFSFLRYSDCEIEINFWKGFKESYKDRKNDYDAVYAKLEDEESRVTFNSLVEFKINHNFDVMTRFTDKQKEQYFEPFLNLQEKGEVFVDVGGFDGLNSIEFAKRCPQYDKIYFLEPDAKILEGAKESLKTLSNIEFHETAASDKKCILHFESNGMVSKISDGGDIEIHADAIDNIIHDKVTFMKMDIEGAESSALTGAKELISKYHPRLAVSVYHKGSDFIEIPKLVLGLYSNYKLYMRHYTEGIAETVMFFIP